MKHASFLRRAVLLAALMFASTCLRAESITRQLYYITATNGNALAGDGLRRINVDGSGATIISEGNVLTNATALALDPARNRAFIADSLPSGSQKIVTISLTDGTITPFLDTPSLTVNDMEVDAANGFLYFITATNGNAVAGDGLRRVKLDGTGLEIILDGNTITNARSLALDVAHNRAFIYESFSGKQAIFAVDLTSGALSLFLDTVNLTTLAMTVDPVNSHLYFSCATNGNAVLGDGLRRINLDGTGLTSIAEANQITNANAMALDLENNAAFIACSFAGRQRIYKLDLLTSSVTPFLETPNLTLNGLAILGPIDPIAPTIVSVTPPSPGIYRAEQDLDFTVNGSEALVVTGTPSLELTIGSTTRNANYVSGSGSSALLFRYTVQAGETDGDGIVMASALSLNGGTIKSAGGTDASLNFNSPSISEVLVDAVAPQIISIERQSPGQQTTATNAVVFKVTFSESVTNVTSDSFSFSRVGDSTVTGSIASVAGESQTYFVTVNVTGGRGEFRLIAINPYF
jgi:hypothetical protein